MCSRLSFFLGLLGLVLLLTPQNIRCCEIIAAADDETNAGPHEHDEAVAVSILYSFLAEKTTYQSLMNHFKLQPLPLSAAVNYDDAAQPTIFSQIIAHNFIEGHFFEFRNYFGRISTSEPSRRYNEEILYKIMVDRDIINFLGHENCFEIINQIIDNFISHINLHSSQLAQPFRSISTQIVDFLEFILEEMVPKYPYKRGDPEYNIETFCEFEYPVFLTVIEIFPMSVISAFREYDILRVIVRRYSKVWPISSTETIIKYSSTLLKYKLEDHIQVLSIMVRSTPGYFLISKHLKQYKPIEGILWDIFALMNNMAPIFRALMMIDPENIQNTYLKLYQAQVSNFGCETCLRNGNITLRVLNLFIKESKFSIITSKKMFTAKKLLLSKILKEFFGVESESLYSFARDCISRELLALYEAILQFLSADVFIEEDRKELLEMIVFAKGLSRPLTAILITMGYLNFEDFASNLRHIEIFSSVVSSSSSQTARERDLNHQANGARWIKEIDQLLSTCPLSGIQSIAVSEDFQPVPWPCPDIVRDTFTENDCEKYMKLFHYAQVILCQRFNIPFHNVSLFESQSEEGVSWSEFIGFINFMIETMAKFLGRSDDDWNLFKFVDTTEYKVINK